MVELVEELSTVLKQAGIFSDPDLEHSQGASASAKHGEANQVTIIPHHNDAPKSGRTFKAFPRYEPD